MKLRYYLRGLGIGMIVTALLMGIALKDNRSLSNAEIRAKALELGMVDGDSRTLADVQASQKPEMSSSDVPASTDMLDVPSSTDMSADPSASPSDSPSDSSTASDPVELPSFNPVSMVPQTVSPDQGATGESSEAIQDPEQSESVTFEIQWGQSSYAVSRALMEAGLVESASEFDQYLVDNGYSKRISTGTYQIPIDTAPEEIAKIITRSR